MEFLGFSAIPAITIICHLTANGIKATRLDNKWLPLICGLLGGALGVLCLGVLEEGFPATNYITAVGYGIVSGLAATGVNEAVNQLTSK